MPSRIFSVAAATMMMLSLAHAQQSHWASPDDPAAKYIVDMERKWAEGVCADNGVVAGLLADDFQGTSTSGARFTKADELKDEKSQRSAHDCGLDEAKVHFFGDSLAIVYGSEHAWAKISLSRPQRSARSGPIPGSNARVNGRSSPHRIIGLRASKS